MEKQPSGPYSGDTISFRGGGRRSGVGGGPLPEVMRPRPRRSLGGGGVGRCRELGFKQTEAEQERTEELLEQGSLWAGGTCVHKRTRTGTQACSGTRTYIGKHSQAQACARHTHTHRVMGARRAVAGVSEHSEARAWGGLATAQGLGRGQVRTGQGPANRPKGG